MSKNTKQSAQDKVLSRISLRRFAETPEIADLVYFLSSEKFFTLMEKFLILMEV